MMESIQYLKKKDERLAKVIEAIGPLNTDDYNREDDSFAFLAKEIVGQMISAGVRKVIIERIYDLCGNDLCAETVSKLSVEQLKSTGLSQAKSSYINNLATIVINNEIDFNILKDMPDNEVKNALTSIKGIGDWTAKMYLIFYLQRNDILPYEDGAFLQAYKWLYNTKVIKPDSIIRRCRKWKPYTSIGARYMYKALDMGLTKVPIKDFLGNFAT